MRLFPQDALISVQHQKIPPSPSTAQLLANASDVDGDTLSVNSLKLNSDSAALTNNDDGTWTITPNANWNGKLQISYAVSDGNGGSADLTANLDVTPVNDAPLLTGILAKLGFGKEDKPSSFAKAICSPALPTSMVTTCRSSTSKSLLARQPQSK